MKINELLIESTQLDELSWKDAGNAAIKATQGVAQGAGMVPGFVGNLGKNFVQGMRKGYNAGGTNNQIKAGVTKGLNKVLGDPNDIKSQIKQKQQEITQLQQQLGQAQQAPAQDQTQANAQAPADDAVEQPDNSAGANAIGNVAKTIQSNQPPETSSTGGSTQQTMTGVKHTSNPNNPNNQQATEPGLSPEEQAANRAKGKEQAPYGFNPQTGQPNPAPAEKNMGNVEEVPANNAALNAPAADATQSADNVVAAQTKARGGRLPGGQQSQSKSAIRRRDQRAADKAAQPTNKLANAKVVKGGKVAQPTQAELDADHARLATGTESRKIKGKPVVEFYSRFLGKML